MTRPKFDSKLIPGRIAVDTGFLLRALGLETDQSGLCESLLRDLVSMRVEIQVPAPVIAEIVLGGVARAPQTTSGLLVTAFDELAAVKCGELFAIAEIKAGDKPPSVLKFDSMIIACAVRWDAKHIISFDESLRKRATKAGVLGKEPADYLEKDLFSPVLQLKK